MAKRTAVARNVKHAATRRTVTVPTSRFIVKKKGSDVFVNGYKLLVPKGPRTISDQKLRAAIEEVVRKRKRA